MKSVLILACLLVWGCDDSSSVGTMKGEDGPPSDVGAPPVGTGNDSDTGVTDDPVSPDSDDTSAPQSDTATQGVTEPDEEQVRIDWVDHHDDIQFVGDIDGDGMDDVMAGVARTNEERWSGVGCEEGKLVAPDGFFDPPGPGAVFLFYGKQERENGVLSEANPDVTFVRELGLRAFGASVTRLGDIDGDGLDDALIGTGSFGMLNILLCDAVDRVDENTPYAHILYGANIRLSGVQGVGTAAVPLRESENTPLGAASSGIVGASLGDIDGDGLHDFAVIRKENEVVGPSMPTLTRVTSPQTAHIYYGSKIRFADTDPPPEPDATYALPAPASSGDALTLDEMIGAGDLDGDGAGDWVIAYHHSVDGHVFESRHFVDVFFGGSRRAGAVAEPDVRLTWHRDAAIPFIEYAPARAVGDFDGDGRDELAILLPFVGIYLIQGEKLPSDAGGMVTASLMDVAEPLVTLAAAGVSIHYPMVGGDFNGQTPPDILFSHPVADCPVDSYNCSMSNMMLPGSPDWETSPDGTVTPIDGAADVRMLAESKTMGDFDNDGIDDALFLVDQVTETVLLDGSIPIDQLVGPCVFSKVRFGSPD